MLNARKTTSYYDSLPVGVEGALAVRLRARARHPTVRLIFRLDLSRGPPPSPPVSPAGGRGRRRRRRRVLSRAPERRARVGSCRVHFSGLRSLAEISRTVTFYGVTNTEKRTV